MINHVVPKFIILILLVQLTDEADDRNVENLFNLIWCLDRIIQVFDQKCSTRGQNQSDSSC